MFSPGCYRSSEEMWSENESRLSSPPVFTDIYLSEHDKILSLSNFNTFKLRSLAKVAVRSGSSLRSEMSKIGILALDRFKGDKIPLCLDLTKLRSHRGAILYGIITANLSDYPLSSMPSLHEYSKISQVVDVDNINWWPSGPGPYMVTGVLESSPAHVDHNTC